MGFAAVAPQEIDLDDALAVPAVEAFRAEGVGVGGIFGRLERDLNMALHREVVGLVGLALLNYSDQVGRICHVEIGAVFTGRARYERDLGLGVWLISLGSFVTAPRLSEP